MSLPHGRNVRLRPTRRCHFLRRGLLFDDRASWRRLFADDQVHGIVLARPPGEAVFKHILGALIDHLVLVFPAQALDEDSHAAFSARFGTLQHHVLKHYVARTNPGVIYLTNLDASGKPKGEHPDPGAMIWHTDGSWSAERSLATSLYGIAVPQSGGPTAGGPGGGRAIRPLGPQSTALRLWGSIDVPVDGRHLTNVIVTLQQGLTVSGRVAFQGTTLQPPADLTRLRISLTPADPGSAPGVMMNAAGTVDASGRFTIASVIPGLYRFGAGNAGPERE